MLLIYSDREDFKIQAELASIESESLKLAGVSPDHDPYIDYLIEQCRIRDEALAGFEEQLRDTSKLAARKSYQVGLLTESNEKLTGSLAGLRAAEKKRLERRRRDRRWLLLCAFYSVAIAAAAKVGGWW